MIIHKQGSAFESHTCISVSGTKNFPMSKQKHKKKVNTKHLSLSEKKKYYVINASKDLK